MSSCYKTFWHSLAKLSSKASTTGSAMSEDGTVSESGFGAPLFQPIVAPRLRSTEVKEVVDFLRLRMQYEDLVEERKNTHGEKIIALSIKSSIEPSLLKSLCKYELTGGKTVMTVTDKDLNDYLKTLVKGAADNGKIDIEELFRTRLIMDLGISDPKARVFKLFQDFEDLVEKNGLEEIFKETGQKLAVKQLLNAIRPASLRDFIEKDLKFMNRKAKSALSLFYNLVQSTL